MLEFWRVWKSFSGLFYISLVEKREEGFRKEGETEACGETWGARGC